MQVFVIDQPVPNAFVLPGGKIFVFTGILPIAKNQAGLAAVLSHEMSHQIAHHSGRVPYFYFCCVAETIAKQRVLLFFQLLASSLFSDLRWLIQSPAMDLVFMKPNSRAMESEADLIGLCLMEKAGYNVQEAVEMWKRMAALAPKQMEFASTHPSNERRIRDLEAWIREKKK